MQEVESLVSRRHIEIEQADGRLQQEYDHRLTETLHQMRCENDEQIKQNRAEVEMMYETKVRVYLFVIVNLRLVFHSIRTLECLVF